MQDLLKEKSHEIRLITIVADLVSEEAFSLAIILRELISREAIMRYEGLLNPESQGQGEHLKRCHKIILHLPVGQVLLPAG